ncbi:MAG: ABC transporter ATP-binding protein [Thermoanaerobaculia bacterium]|nr:ATP-binding cassette domain-containing protein [Acidobacteriota bacterium]
MTALPAERALDAPLLLEAADLRKVYRARATGNPVVAVDGVSFAIRAGETLALVGESGSGKTTIGRLVARLESADAGAIRFDGEDWLALSGRALRRKRRDLQVVFQDPQTSLNPRMRVGDQVGEPLRVQNLAPRRDLATRVARLLEEVGLDPASAARFPSEFSGGQRQRIAIARALATRPRLLVCDEPVSALDASIAAQIVNLLLDLQRDLGLAYLFISHDLPLVPRVADRVAVLYLGRIIEEGEPAAVFGRPLHPYTAALVSSVPRDRAGDAPPRISLPGEPGSALGWERGCGFAPRCPIARPRCRVETPGLDEVGPGSRAACFYPGELRVPASP